MISSAYRTSNIVKQISLRRIIACQLGLPQPQGRMHRRRTCLGKVRTGLVKLPMKRKRRSKSRVAKMLPVPALKKRYRVKTRTLASSLRLKMATIRSQVNMRLTTVKIVEPVNRPTIRSLAKLEAETRYKKSKNGR